MPGLDTSERGGGLFWRRASFPAPQRVMCGHANVRSCRARPSTASVPSRAAGLVALLWAIESAARLSMTVKEHVGPVGPGSDPVLKQPTEHESVSGLANSPSEPEAPGCRRSTDSRTRGDTSSGPLVVLRDLWCSRAGVPGTAGPPFWTELVGGGVAQTGGTVGALADSTDLLPG